MMNGLHSGDRVIRASITIPLTVEQVFYSFTAEFGDWWPLADYSVGAGESAARAVKMSAHLNGEILEELEGGRHELWGKILLWDPPRRLAFTWHPGDTPERATRVEIAVDSTPFGARIDLTHSHWNHIYDEEEWRSYNAGWHSVLAKYAEYAMRGR